MNDVRRKNRRTLLIWSGFMFSVGMNIVLIVTFFCAYFSPAKSVVVTVNEFHEADVEFVMVPFVFVVTCVGLYFSSKQVIDMSGSKQKKLVGLCEEYD